MGTRQAGPPPKSRGPKLAAASIILVSSTVAAFWMVAKESAPSVALRVADPVMVVPTSAGRVQPLVAPVGTSAPPARPTTQRVQTRVMPPAQTHYDPVLAASLKKAAEPGQPMMTSDPPGPPDGNKVSNYGLEPFQEGGALTMLDVSSYPSGATVEVNGVVFGRTPMVRPMPDSVESLKVRLTMIGFASVEQTLKVGKDRRLRLASVLEPSDEQPRRASR